MASLQEKINNFDCRILAKKITILTSVRPNPWIRIRIRPNPVDSVKIRIRPNPSRIRPNPNPLSIVLCPLSESKSCLTLLDKNEKMEEEPESKNSGDRPEHTFEAAMTKIIQKTFSQQSMLQKYYFSKKICL